ncbi:sugar ABC transporter substrate-binding protein [Aerococcus sp. UMB1112A]|uniref:sugar ABC transporter substrate-binding protein n=1 Tax=Aerococcus sp. UMB1112A TaxID=3050609 RepID=UPI002549C8E4|nr:sugar ABC transporter substrate-binding protein [Aerococcus sp. UMB1112A]MDK8502574.1 sugar ABC transporter substrate-binding protein [Aerococcus sp. UMB1112A]
MKKPFKYLASTSLLLAFLAGCSNAGMGIGEESSSAQDNTDPQSEEAAGNGEKQEISFMIPEYGQPSDEMLKDFENETGIKVNVMPTSWDDIRDKISTAAVGKKAAADVFEVDWSWVGEFKEAGWLAPLEVDEATVKDIPSLKTFQVGTDYYAIPYSNEYRMSYMNQKQFNQAGLDQAPQTWQDVVQAAEQIKDQGVVKYPVALPMAADENTTTSFLTINYALTGEVFNKDNTLNRDNALETLKIMDELNQKELVDPAYRTTNEGKYDLIKKGEASYAVAPSFYAIRVDSEKDSAVQGEVEVVPLPGKDGPSNRTDSFVEAVGVSPYSENPEAAKKFVDWYTSEETQKELFKEVEILPTRKSALQAVVSDGQIRESEEMLQLADMVGSPFPNGVPKYYTEMSTEIFNTISEMANGKLTPEEAADQMTEKVNAIVETNA